MSSPPPTKPPRGVKQGKETSGLLMSVIRTLSASETNEQRDREKAKLEKEYKKCDQRLDELVAAHSGELTQVMQVFSTSCAAVNTCRTRMRGAKARLAACRGLLRVRRDDLRRLWADARKHKYALDMLSQIDQLVTVDKEVTAHLSRNHYLNAASVLQSALVLANTELSEVDALQHLRIDLEQKKQCLVDRTMVALAAEVYRTDIGGLRRQGSSRERNQSNALALIIAELTKSERLSNETLQDINPEFELSLTEEDRTLKVTMTILIESLAVLEKVKESTEKLKVQMQTELLQIITSVSQQVLDYGVSQLPTLNGPVLTSVNETDCVDDAEEQSDPQYQLLMELLTSLLESYRIVAQRQKVMLDIWKQTISKHELEDIQLYTMQHYWNSIQSVLQLLLTDYLDIQNLTLTTRTNFTEQSAPTDINIYFSKKKSQSKKKVRLFKFAQSEVAQHKAQNESANMDAVTLRGKAYHLVCRPRPENLAHIYNILESFMTEIENNCSVKECSLRAFISDHIRTAEVERISTTTKQAIESAMKEGGAWREAGPPSKKADGQQMPIMIFTCVTKAWSAAARTARAARRVSPHAGALLGAAVPGLLALAAGARAAHRHHLHAAPRTRSQAWLADDDIVRFLKSLPNWHILKNPPSKSKKSSSQNQILDQDMKQSFEREAEILGSSLGDGTVSQKEIISSNNTLRDIAIMCESMDWVCTKIRDMPSSLNTPNGSVIKLSERTTNEILTTAALFEELSDTCLLLLHLELRIQCFHYLGQEDSTGGGLALGAGEGATTETGAARLAAAVRTFHEDASHILQPAKMNYILAGLGEMMSAGVVGRARGRAGGGAAAHAQRLAALRHCLAAVGLPSDGLHRAAAYLDMLTCTPEEILALVKEKGPQFSELEYLNAFNLIGKSKHQSEADMKVYLNKLSHILGNVGVTV